MSKTISKRPVISFFLFTFLLAIPFYVLGALASLNIYGEPYMAQACIAIFTITPLIAASILSAREHGFDGFKDLLARAFDVKRVTDKRWFLPIFLLSPLIYLLALICELFSGASIQPAQVAFIALPIVFLVFFVMAACEEIGWMGYAFDSLEEQFGALRGGMILGIIWAAWHAPLLYFLMPDPIVFSAQLISIALNRVLIVWLFNNTGKSVFAATTYHAVSNVVLVGLPQITHNIPWNMIIVGISVVAIGSLWRGRAMTQCRLFNQKPDS